jgi:hypothetical protein
MILHNSSQRQPPNMHHYSLIQLSEGSTLDQPLPVKTCKHRFLKKKLQTHLLRRYVRYRTKSNTALETEIAFVHLNCIAQFA